MPDQRGCTGKPLCQPSRLPHEYRPGIRPKDATDKEARPPRSRGRSVVVLYNAARTHLSVNKDAPSPRTVHAVGRILPTPFLGGLNHLYVRVWNPERIGPWISYFLLEKQKCGHEQNGIVTRSNEI